MDALIPVDEALSRIFTHCFYHKTELSDLDSGFGKILAENVYAIHDVPSFDRAMLDGYAVRYKDIKQATRDHPIILEVTAHVPAGSVPDRELQQGEAFRTMTGAPIAGGADTLIQQEWTDFGESVDTTKVSVFRSVNKGEAIQHQGHDIREGQLLLPKGSMIGPVEIALLASQGIFEISTMTPPRIGIFSTGSEIIEINGKREKGKIYNSNTPMLTGLLRKAGAEVVSHPAIIDDHDLLWEKFHDALNRFDMVVTTGGVSVGDWDLTPKILEEIGVRRLFWGVFIRPGTPIYAGVFQDKLVFALSGNPPAAFVNAHVFVLPAIQKMLSLKDGAIHSMTARLQHVPKKKKVRHTRFLTGRLYERDNEWWIDVGGDQSAGTMSRFVHANALARIEPSDEMSEGERVQVDLL